MQASDGMRVHGNEVQANHTIVVIVIFPITCVSNAWWWQGNDGHMKCSWGLSMKCREHTAQCAWTNSAFTVCCLIRNPARVRFCFFDCVHTFHIVWQVIHKWRPKRIQQPRRQCSRPPNAKVVSVFVDICMSRKLGRLP